MANTHRGETRLVVGEKEYTLALTTNAIALAEERLREGIGGVFQRWADGKWAVIEVRVLLWAALRRHHAKLTPEQAGDLIDEIGTGEAIRTVAQTWAASQPQAEELAGNAQAASGTGPAS